MAEEKINEQNTENTENEVDYIAEIQKLKSETVSKDKYDKLTKENKKLLEALVNNQQIELPQESNKRTIEDIEKDLLSGDHNNLDYIKLALEHRNACLDAGRDDPFVGRGEKYTPGREDYESAERVAKALQEAVDYADGNSEIFTQEFQRICNDPFVPTKKSPRR